MNKPILIGVAAVARAGKDTVADMLIPYIDNPLRVAYANELKDEIDPFLKEIYGISAWTTDDKEKTIIRPHLVELGHRRRSETNGAYWIDKVEPKVKAALYSGRSVIICDNRYANEGKWVHSLGGKIIYIERILENGLVRLPANNEEKINDPQIREIADITLTWPTAPKDQLEKIIGDLWKQISQ